MQGLKRLQEAIERHRENKDINIKYKTPLTSKYHCAFSSAGGCSSQLSLNFSTLSSVFVDCKGDSLLTSFLSATVRNVNTFTDEQAIDDACNPIRCDRHVRISEWVRGIKRVRTSCDHYIKFVSG